jgi:hypothetical protein
VALLGEATTVAIVSTRFHGRHRCHGSLNLNFGEGLGPRFLSLGLGTCRSMEWRNLEESEGISTRKWASPASPAA